MVRVVCALSGGVDSSVAAHCLREQGHEVIAVFMRNGVRGGGAVRSRACCSASDARDAARVASRLDIPFYAIDCEREFRHLIDDFVLEYGKGRTPSPCVLCNQDLKFGHLYQVANALEAEQIATGHYVRLEPRARAGTAALYRARDREKDQSYFLFGIGRANLSRVRFPLGELRKDEVRAIARKARLPTAEKAESMELCFVSSGDYRDLLRERGAMSPGRFVDRAGNDLGMHTGYEGFTIGQRRGLPSGKVPRYVLELRPATREVVIGSRSELEVPSCEVSGLRWVIEEPRPGSKLEVLAQIRARHEAAPARLEILDGQRGRLRFHIAQEAVAPGQAAALYEGDRLLGGGWIDRDDPED